MIFHDHMMTIAQEVQYVWGQRLSGATLIFLLNRYMVLTLGVAIILQVVPWDTPLNSQSCEATILLYDVVSIALYIVIALFSALRAYAIGGRNWLAALTTLSLGLAIAVASMYFTAKSSYADVLVIEHIDDNLSRIMSVVLSALIATRLCAVLADALLIGLTLYKTLKIQRTINPGTWAPLTKSLVKDGSLYFISLLFLNVLQMVLKSVNGALTNYVSVFVAP
ncbi:hypothetical protein EVJ58_g4395 [Rhodofomes roseus]|uniref:DUF6533 domain-containing protein n=1 Tax=Rhodofomes roseus TaxID=34475 RepID=A0A4Y9YH04_9APHY|nr:hypothetical protein EVJ58_g4395 [Rhodofomes roseus]